MNNSFFFKNIISLSLLFGTLSPISYAENFALLGCTEHAKFGASELLNALIAMGGSMPYNEPVPSVYRDDTQKNSIDKAKARAYAIAVAAER